MGFVNECVRYEYSVTNAGSVSAPIIAAVPAGRTIVLAVNAPALNAITSFTATDSKGNAWNQRAFAANAMVVNGQGAILVCHVTTALTTSDTVTVTAVTRSPDRWAVLALQFDDILTSAATDQTATTAGGIGSALTVGPTAATTQADELVVAAFPITAAPTVTAGSGFTAQPIVTTSNATAPKSLIVEWRYVTTTGAQTAAATLSASQSWAGMIVTLKKAAAPALYDRYVVKSGAWSPATAVFG